MSTTCLYCKTVFSTKNSMISHQKKTKYCLLIQKELNPQLESENIACDHCGKTFTRKDVKNNHQIGCRNNKDTLLQIIKEHEIKIKEKDDEIMILKGKLENEIKRGDLFEKLHSRLEGCVEKIALQPKHSTTTNTLNIPQFNTTLEQLTLAAMDKFDENLFLQGQIGAAKFFLDHVKKSHNGELPWVVADKSREILKFKDDKDIVVDSKAKRLTQLVSDALKTKNQEHYDNIYKSIKNTKSDSDISDNSDNEDGSTEITDDDEDNETLSNDIKEQQADKCFIELNRLTKDNKVFRKKLIEETFK